MKRPVVELRTDKILNVGCTDVVTTPVEYPLDLDEKIRTKKLTSNQNWTRKLNVGANNDNEVDGDKFIAFYKMQIVTQSERDKPRISLSCQKLSEAGVIPTN